MQPMTYGNNVEPSKHYLLTYTNIKEDLTMGGRGTKAGGGGGAATEEAQTQEEGVLVAPDKETLEAETTPFVRDMLHGEVEWMNVQQLDTPLTHDEIVDKLAGGDLTGGSCASLAFAYAANVGGYDVTDYRGGESRDAFSRFGTVRGILTKSEGGVLKHTFTEIDTAKSYLDTMIPGSNYVLSTGAHAAIVRRKPGTKSRFEYLEMQSPVKAQNGWQALSKSTLGSRFGASKGAGYAMIAPVGGVANSGALKSTIGYLNTKKADQKKGSKGQLY